MGNGRGNGGRSQRSDSDRSHADALQGALAQMARHFMSLDFGSLDESRVVAGKVEALVDLVKTSEPVFDSMHRSATKSFSDISELDSVVFDSPFSLGFFPTVYRPFSELILFGHREYGRLVLAYDTFVRGRLENDKVDGSNGGNDLVDVDLITSGLGGRQNRSGYDHDPHLRDGAMKRERDNIASLQRAVQKTRDISLKSIDVYASVKLSFPKVLDAMQKNIGGYSKYLKQRFVKSEDDDGKSPQKQMMMFIDDGTEERVNYVKIKLIDGNPVLTDVLLGLADSLPLYQERTVHVFDGNKRPKKRVIKEVSEHAVQESVDRILALSDPHFLEYVADPHVFFQRIGSSLDNFFSFFESAQKYHEDIIRIPQVSLDADNDTIFDLLAQDMKKLKRQIVKIQNASLDDIVQDEDKVLPENKTEIDHFKLRDEMLDVLYSALKDISVIDRNDDLLESRREEIARTAILRAVDLKRQIKDILTPSSARRLRQDKKSDNEYYMGRQGHIGMFYFEREPTPDVRMDDVIGATFDRAKTHLSQIIETAQFPHLMRLSAPGGKVRSNILLIGPYGCGKSELARAVCADERVIGASVSVAGTLTAYMHESVNNVKRVYDAAKGLYKSGRELKPVVLVLDEFDGWFGGHSGHTFTDTDMQQIENVLLEVLDGMGDYNGVITMAMTNQPDEIPKGILRRFRYVDVVGELTKDERASMLKMYIEKSLPVSSDVAQHYDAWALRLENAPGDVVRKVVDEVHFKLVPPFLSDNPRDASLIQRTLYKREVRRGSSDEKDVVYLRERLRRGGVIVTPAHVTESIDYLLSQRPIQLQIEKSKEVYENSKSILDSLGSNASKSGFGLRSRDKLWGQD